MPGQERWLDMQPGSLTANATSEDGIFVATRIATLFAFVVVVHMLGAVLYLLFLDLLSLRWTNT